METAHFIACGGAFDPNQVVRYKVEVIHAEKSTHLGRSGSNFWVDFYLQTGMHGMDGLSESTYECEYSIKRMNRGLQGEGLSQISIDQPEVFRQYWAEVTLPGVRAAAR